MNLWFVKSKSGWLVREYTGKLIAYEVMPCNCKGHAFNRNVSWKYISERSSPQQLNDFYLATGLRYETKNHNH